MNYAQRLYRMRRKAALVESVGAALADRAAGDTRLAVAVAEAQRLRRQAIEEGDDTDAAMWGGIVATLTAPIADRNPREVVQEIRNA